MFLFSQYSFSFFFIFFLQCLIPPSEEVLKPEMNEILGEINWKYQHHNIYLSNKELYFLQKESLRTKIHSSLSVKSKRKYERMEYLCLNKTQRDWVHDSFKKMKNDKVENHTVYDLFVLHHDYDKSPSAHNGPSFIIWHRFFLLMIELMMKKYAKNSMMPYWDNRLLARGGPNPRHSVFFSDELIGNAFGEVKSGFAKGFKTPSSSSCQEISPTLSRSVPTNLEGLFSESFRSYIQNSTDYKSLCIPWDETFEAVHGMVHVFIGDLMAYLSCAPSDPIFYFHHCFVDYMYEKHFRKLKENDPNTLNYPDIREKIELEKTFSGDSIMMPFGILHKVMLKEKYFIPHYIDSPGDVDCEKDEDCCSNGNTQYIFCHNRMCISKIQEGGFIKAGFPSKACYCKEPKKPSLNGRRCICN